MVVSYSLELSKIGFTTGVRLLAKWRGSIFKVIYRELILFLFLYAMISIIYRLSLNDEGQLAFESLAMLCRKYTAKIPTTFILGFYVSIVFTRWQGMVNSLPWIDQPSYFLSFLPGTDARSRLYRRSIVRYWRYLVSSQVLALRAVSLQVKKRFPTHQHVVDAALLTAEEMKQLEEIQAMDGDTKYWVPCFWSVNILNKARQENKINSDMLLNTAVQKIMDMRGCLGGLMMYDWINIPLVYTQLVVLVVWSYFLAALIGQQWLAPETDNDPKIDLFFPIFTAIEFVCIVGWLNVATNMLNPLGENDNDMELNWLLDRNFKMGFLLTDELHLSFPVLKMDTFADPDIPNELPHTEASKNDIQGGMNNSAVNVDFAFAMEEGGWTVAADEDGAIQMSESRVFRFRGSSGGSSGRDSGRKPSERRPSAEAEIRRLPTEGDKEKEGRVERPDSVKGAGPRRLSAAGVRRKYSGDLNSPDTNSASSTTFHKLETLDEDEADEESGQPELVKSMTEVERKKSWETTRSTGSTGSEDALTFKPLLRIDEERPLQTLVEIDSPPSPDPTPPPESPVYTVPLPDTLPPNHGSK